MYDPSFDNQDNDTLWDFSLIGGDPRIRVTGYVPTFPDIANYRSLGSHMIISNLNFSLTQRQIRIDNMGNTIGAPPATDRVLVTCAIISARNSTVDLAGDNFTAVIGNPKAPQHSTSHLKGTTPAGGNQCMLDTHVEWHKFVASPPDTIVRSQNIPPYFWW
jgi:hypothetical protein